MSGRVVVVGSLNMDLVVRTPRHPRPGETLFGSDFATFPGGKGANQAVAAARLGAQVALIGRVGGDGFGASLTAGLQADGIDTTHVTVDDGAPTGIALIAVDQAGENTIIVASGANMRVATGDIDAATAMIADAAVLAMPLETPLATVRRAVALAKRHNTPVIVNAAPAQPLDRDLLAAIDILIVNETELALVANPTALGLTAKVSDDHDDIEHAVRRLQSVGCRRVIATLGEAGCLVAAGEVWRSLPGHRVAVVDTTAAGDAFVGAVATAIAAGEDTFAAAEWGNAAGALAVTKAGAQPSLPTRAEFDRFRVGQRQ